MSFQCDPDSFAGRTEVLCETIIEALRELRAATSGPVTPSLLSQSLIRNNSYLDTLSAAAQRTSVPEHSEGHRLCVKQLQNFQVDLLRTIGSAFSQDASPRADELCMQVGKKSHIDEAFKLNTELLDFIAYVSRKASRRQKELFDLLAEVTRNLFEVDSSISRSLSNAQKAYSGSRAISEAIEQNVEDISRVVDSSRNLDELKSLISSKLEAIKHASMEKLKIEEKILHSADEIVALKSQIRAMRRQVSEARRRASTMEKASLLDPLTGVANRRSYQRYIREEWDVYAKMGEAFSILLIDVDNFKSVNDRFGHWAGDKCLAELAKRMKIILRGTDFVARYGGDEFIAVLPETEKGGAVAVAEKLRAHIEQTRFMYRKDRIPVTISIGVSAVCENDQSVRSVLDRVDHGLYKAKGSGRNRVFVV